MSHIINFDDMRVTLMRKKRIGSSGCQHLKLTFDDEGQTVVCDDCGKQVTAYWAFQMLVLRYDISMQKLAARQKIFEEAKLADVSLLAARKVQEAWRSRTMVPTCPHCGRGISAHDGFGGFAINKKMEARRRQSNDNTDVAASGANCEN